MCVCVLLALDPSTGPRLSSSAFGLHLLLIILFLFFFFYFHLILKYTFITCNSRVLPNLVLGLEEAIGDQTGTFLASHSRWSLPGPCTAQI